MRARRENNQGKASSPADGGDCMDPTVREELVTAVRALDDALSGLVTFMMTLRPTLRNEILQICGHHLERARQAKERLEAMLQDGGEP
jgi:hypothetical protein